MKILLNGKMYENTGPSNVNKYIIENSKFDSVKTKNKILRNFEIMNKILKNDVIVFSGFTFFDPFFIKISKLFKKKTIYLLHGLHSYEDKINGLKHQKRISHTEAKVLKNIDLILCVSENYKDWMVSLFPKYENKLYFLNSGIDMNLFQRKERANKIKEPNTIIACGGNRNTKNNKILCEVIDEMNKQNDKCKLDIYGVMYENGENIENFENAIVHGRVSRDELYEKLNSTRLFILNTTRESFGLSVIDALQCGCNILISQNAGILSILNLEENDIIKDVNDKEEIKNKIKYNLENDNNKRILDNFDKEHYSWENVTNRLENICQCLKEGKNFRNIR